MQVWGPRTQRQQTETIKGFYCPQEKDRIGHWRGRERLGWHSWQTLQERARAVSCSQGRKKDSYSRAINADRSTCKAPPTKSGDQSRLRAERSGWERIRGVIWSQTDQRETDRRDPAQLATAATAATPTLPGPQDKGRNTSTKSLCSPAVLLVEEQRDPLVASDAPSRTVNRPSVTYDPWGHTSGLRMCKFFLIKPSPELLLHTAQRLLNCSSSVFLFFFIFIGVAFLSVLNT